MARDTAPLAGLDLNLLVSLRALLREGSVTRAATRLGQSQPTVSRALATLRHAFDDPLLVRSGRAMVLTPRAESIRVPLERTLASLDRLRAIGDFDPTTDARVFRITMPDVLGTLVIPTLMQTIADTSSGTELQILGSERDLLTSLLQDEVDVVVAAPQLDHPELYARRVGHPMGWSVVCGPLHPQREGFDAEAWIRSGHVLLAPHGRPDLPTHLDQHLASIGRAREIRLHVGYLSALRDTLLRTPLVTSLPTKLARHLAAGSALSVLPHPMEDVLGQLEVWMTWHEAQHADDGHAWLREALVDALDQELR